MDYLRRNIKPEYYNWLNELIAEDVQTKAFDYKACMVNWNYEYNLSSFIRNANAFGVKEIYYLQDKKKYDKRGTVGVHNYSKVTHLTDYKSLLKAAEGYSIVAVENNINNTKSLKTFEWPRKPFIIFGSEGMGLEKDILDKAEHCVEIPLQGSVRSLNVATCSGIIFNDYLNKVHL